ncbi:ATP-dependent DNA helicase [Staphylococcus sp. SQ8-PEA]|uniref:ATP-dependent DNA helicase RecQ n=1 Tax=Staphylococcus marylandisciuri TaxID=2981529 RepID=A0ABT2QNB8_9STAP|nr:ATP-dependent DNA helicase RecQ [Staphylococcus marylandisciuri]MCU5745470.1 ATP-dependent DNA helicase [Staphylococcus marylandisciuri]
MLHRALKQYFGFDSFKEGQQEVIERVLNNEDTLGILPTGSGKSLCYQLPTYINEKATLIISPLISLMDDQVAQLKANGEYRVSYIHSGMDEKERYYNIKALKSSRFIFLSPEFILQPNNIKLIQHLNFGLIVLDEAHCLTEWGYDFRPHYALVGKITKHFNNTTILALTATAPPTLEHDLNYILSTQFSLVRTSMNRPNISLSHKNLASDEEKIDWLLKFIERSGSTIIYVSSKKKCYELAKSIYQKGYLTGIYHGDMSYQERQTVQEQFINNTISIIVATSAFGMGVNKPDVRTIIHFHLPTSPSNYLQEIGRAGRDGKYSQAISLYQPDDTSLLETLLFTDAIKEEDIKLYKYGQLLDEYKLNILDTLSSHYRLDQLVSIFKQAYLRKKEGFHRILGYKDLTTCRRVYLLNYFNEGLEEEFSRCCDNDSELPSLKITNKKKVKRKQNYKEKLEQLFNTNK